MPHVSLVIPAYNEEAILRASTEETISRLENITESFEIILSENKSDDNTPEIAATLATEYPRVRWLQQPTPGKGIAVATAFQDADGEILVAIDADLATDMQHLPELIHSITAGYDIATGSRWIPGHEADRPLNRTLASKTYNFLARKLVGTDLRDHQCGFKAFSRDVVAHIMPKIKSTHWFWDTEFLALATQFDYQIKEFPVQWEPMDDSSVSLSQDAPTMFTQLLSLRARLQTIESRQNRPTPDVE